MMMAAMTSNDQDQYHRYQKIWNFTGPGKLESIFHGAGETRHNTRKDDE